MGKDTLARLASVHAPAHRHRILHRRREADARAQSGFGTGQIIHRARNGFRGSIVVLRGEGQAEPRIILTDLAPEEPGRSLRFWIETGFKALKSRGRQWRNTRRTDPARAERNRLVLSVATPLTPAFGSRMEDAQALKRCPGALRAQPYRERISPWHGDAEPPSDQGQDAARRPAAARTAAASAGQREGGCPRTPKPTPASPLWKKARVKGASRARRPRPIH